MESRQVTAIAAEHLLRSDSPPIRSPGSNLTNPLVANVGASTSKDGSIAADGHKAIPPKAKVLLDLFVITRS